MYKEGVLGKKLTSTTTIKKKPIRPAKGIVSFLPFLFVIKKTISENIIAPTNNIRKVIVGKPNANA
jgi:hypothetical protein